MCEYCEELYVTTGIDIDSGEIESRTQAFSKGISDGNAIDSEKTAEKYTKSFEDRLSASRSAFMQDMKDTLDELLEVDDDANAAADGLQKAINLQDMQMEYLLEAMSTLILTEDDIANLKFNLLEGYRSDKYTFLEVVYFLSILNEYDNPYDRENSDTDEDFNEWEDE